MFENYKVQIYSNLEIMKFGIEHTQVWKYTYLEITRFGYIQLWKY